MLNKKIKDGFFGEKQINLPGTIVVNTSVILQTSVKRAIIQQLFASLQSDGLVLKYLRVILGPAALLLNS